MANEVIIITEQEPATVLVVNEGPQGPRGITNLGSKTTIYELYAQSVGQLASIVNSTGFELSMRYPLLQANGDGIFLPLNSLSVLDITLIGINPTTGTTLSFANYTSGSNTVAVLSSYDDAWVGNIGGNGIWKTAGVISLNASATDNPANSQCSATLFSIIPDVNGNQAGCIEVDPVTGELRFGIISWNYTSDSIPNGTFDWYMRLAITTLIKA